MIMLGKRVVEMPFLHTTDLMKMVGRRFFSSAPFVLRGKKDLSYIHTVHSQLPVVVIRVDFATSLTPNLSLTASRHNMQLM